MCIRDRSVVAHIFPQVKVNETVKLYKSYHPDYRDGWQDVYKRQA